MGHEEAVDLLQQTLDEEKAADETLSGLAQGGINQSAADSPHPDGESDDQEAQGDEDEAEDDEETADAGAVDREEKTSVGPKSQPTARRH